MRRALVTAALAILALTTTAHAQFELQDSHTTASFRGIHSIGNGIAWASGTEGTVLRTTDEGKTWQHCTTPPEADKLDFRGIQAFDQNTAIVMSSGKGDLSRLYKTIDGCKTWKLVFTNPDKEGFWDALQMGSAHRLGMLLGDPVQGKFRIFVTYDFGDSWNLDSDLPSARDGESAFAASNSSFAFVNSNHLLITGGIQSRLIFYEGPVLNWRKQVVFSERSSKLPLPSSSTGGAFSIAYSGEFHYRDGKPTMTPTAVVVGGDFHIPESSILTAASSDDGGTHWRTPQTPPHGYRSSVAYDASTKTWITVGPNGTDISRDDGKNWSALKPSAEDDPDADKNWNALSLPFVVGPKGRIGKLRPDALKH